MKRYKVFKKDGESKLYIGTTYATPAEAWDELAEYIGNDNESHSREESDADYLTPFDFGLEEVEAFDITTVKSYDDACKVLGIAEMDEKGMKSCGFRPDEIARRKLETITAALNDGWVPDWNNTDEWKFYPYFAIEPNHYGALAGLSYAGTYSAASSSDAYIGSRLCFHDRETAAYAGRTFADLYAQILVEKL